MLADKQSRAIRIWSNQEIKKLAPLFTGDVVNVSAWDDRDKQGEYYKDYFSKASGYYYTNHPGIRGYQKKENEYLLDLTDNLPAELQGRFDVVFNHTTFEHIFEVRKAFKNFCDMTRDVAIVVVPFSQLQHETESWKDYWRFTPSCIREMFQENGLEVIYEAESKYKRAAVYLLLVGSRHPERWKDQMPKFKPIEKAGKWIGFHWLPRIYMELKWKLLENTHKQ